MPGGPLRALPKRAAGGQRYITTAGQLPARHVIHTVGPVWHGGNAGEDDTLQRAYRACMELAAAHRLRSIAFPAISTGVYGFPKARAASIAHRTISAFAQNNPSPESIYFVFFTPTDADIFLDSTPCL